jgi:hypothetical protein
MRYIKMLGLLLVAVAAFASTASATTLTSPSSTTYTGEVVATSTNWELDGPIVTIKCNHAVVQGTVNSHGGASVGIGLVQWGTSGCNYHTTTSNAGSLSIDGSNQVLSSGLNFTANTSVGTCGWTTNFTVVGSITEGTNASWDINSAKIPRTHGNFLCGSSATMTGSFDFVIPNDLWVD